MAEPKSQSAAIIEPQRTTSSLGVPELPGQNVAKTLTSFRHAGLVLLRGGELAEDSVEFGEARVFPHALLMAGEELHSANRFEHEMQAVRARRTRIAANNIVERQLRPGYGCEGLPRLSFAVEEFDDSIDWSNAKFLQPPPGVVPVF